MSKRFIKYSIDLLNSERIAGWCYSTVRRSKPLELSFHVDGDLIGRVTADAYREDLKSYRLHPDGRCGFEFVFPASVRFEGDSQLSIRAGRFGTQLEAFSAREIPRVLTGELPRILFMHIPKTGGTTLNALAVRYFPKDASAIHIEVMDPRSYPHLADEKHYLAGHLTLQKIRAHSGLSRFDLVTLVRDPYRQLHSHMAWIRRIAADTRSGFFLKHEQCIRDLALRLAGTDLNRPANLASLAGGFRGFELDFFDNLQTRYFLDYRPDRVGPADVTRAVANIAAFEIVGIAERFDAFLDRFRRRYGMTGTGSEQSFNRLSDRLFDCEGHAVRAALRPLVEADLELYDHVSRL